MCRGDTRRRSVSVRFLPTTGAKFGELCRDVRWSPTHYGDRTCEKVHYVDHFDNLSTDPPVTSGQWENSSYEEVKVWHADSRVDLSRREDLALPNGMQDTKKTLSIYREVLYPYMRHHHLSNLVEDNVSPHNNDTIRAEHSSNNITSVGYRATRVEKTHIRSLIEAQTENYKREQDRKAQITKQTRELDRLPAWPANSTDLNLIEVVWSWMVGFIMRDGKMSGKGWPRNPGDLKLAAIKAWDEISKESFRELIRSY